MGLTTVQSGRLDDLLAETLPRNRFYAARYARHDPRDFARLPLTTKADLLHDQSAHPPYGSVLTHPREAYCRLHQTSGTSGRPLRWLDTRQSWDWMLDC